jgi:oxygen-independent coproporphyrinogen-3 oxidase
MAGIYIHIPYCRKACHYCDFHFSTTLHTKKELLGSIIKEAGLQSQFLLENGQMPVINSVYFGGGTPSILDKNELGEIISCLNHHFQINNEAEITLEANPDDLSPEKLDELMSASINRLSIGVQSFYDVDLSEMNRAHDASMALNCLRDAKLAGFSNISLDLIYGIPSQSDEAWKENLETAFALDIPHLSCYSLTVEPGTALAHFIQKGIMRDVDEEKGASQFNILLEMTAARGYEQYEISNFCKKGMYSIHNSNYWKGEKYLGLGPSAHSFNGKFRQFNVANNNKYIKSLGEGNIPYTKEILSEAERFNEYLLISLRTIWGCDLKQVKNLFGDEKLSRLETALTRMMDMGLAETANECVTLTQRGKLMADYVSRELFIIP